MVHLRVDSPEPRTPTDLAGPLPATAEPAPLPVARTESRDALSFDAATSARRSMSGEVHPPATAAALALPHGMAAAPSASAAVPRARSVAAAAPAGDERAIVAAHRLAVAEVAAHGAPVQRSGVAAHWVGAIASVPSQVVLVTARTLESATDALFRWNRDLLDDGIGPAISGALLLPVSALLYVLAKLVTALSSLLDLPFAGLRAALRSTIGEEPASRADATHLRLASGDWPPLSLNDATAARVRAWLQAGTPGGYPYDVVVVPGYANDDQTAALSERSIRRLEQAARDLRAGLAPFVMVSGGAVHPPGTPHIEALEMRRYLIDELGVSPDQILVEPHAEHTTTNLRNAGRLMRQLGLRRAVVTTSPEPFGQSYYLQTGDALGYGVHGRAVRELGYELGSLRRIDAWHTAFVPSDAVDLTTLDEGLLAPSDP